MNPSEPVPKTENETTARLRALRYAPAPNLERGRARLMAEMERRSQPRRTLPRRMSIAMAMGVSVAMVLGMFMMAGAAGQNDPVLVAMTRTGSAQTQTLAPAAVPGNQLEPALYVSETTRAHPTPVPELIPEPPPALTLPRPLSPGSVN